MFFVHWQQHPVGHGGFHTGQLHSTDNPPFTWVFDCGSRATRKFESYLRAWTLQHQQPLDWLFISHFDTDHVSGLDTLMGRVVVNDVMIPYVNERELAHLLLREIARDTLNRSIVELTADPASFFLSRGASRVTFLRGERRGGDPEPRGIDPDPPEDDRGWRCKITPMPRQLVAPHWAARPNGASAVRVIDGGVCNVVISHQTYGLHLKPYRAPVPTQMCRGLVKALKNLIGMTVVPLSRRPGLGALAYAVANHARTSKGRSALQALFKAYAGSSNRASLSLLSEPILHKEDHAVWEVRCPRRWTRGKGVAGWVNTGDAELLSTADLTEWRKVYAAELSRVRALALPHHGSDKNSNSSLQALTPDAILAVHVKSTSLKHPGTAVTVAAGTRLARVTEDPSSAMTMLLHAS